MRYSCEFHLALVQGFVAPGFGDARVPWSQRLHQAQPGVANGLRFRCIRRISSEQSLEDRPTWYPLPRERTRVGCFGDDVRHRGARLAEFPVERGFGSQSLVRVGSVKELERQIGITNRPAPKTLTDAS